MDVKHVQEKINTIWKQSSGEKTYLGDWHTHPENYPKPSFTDYMTFSKNYFHSTIDHNFLLYMIFGYEDSNTPKWVGICNGFHTKKIIYQDYVSN